MRGKSKGLSEAGHEPYRITVEIVASLESAEVDA